MAAVVAHVVMSLTSRTISTGSVVAIYDLLYQLIPDHMVMGVCVDLHLEVSLWFIREIDGNAQELVIGRGFKRTGVGCQLDTIHSLWSGCPALDLKHHSLPTFDPARAIHYTMVVVAIHREFHAILSPTGREGVFKPFPALAIPSDCWRRRGRAALVP